MSTPTRSEWDESENVAGAQFRYRSQRDRERIVERIAYALAEQRERAARPRQDDRLRALQQWLRTEDRGNEYDSEVVAALIDHWITGEQP